MLFYFVFLVPLFFFFFFKEVSPPLTHLYPIKKEKLYPRILDFFFLPLVRSKNYLVFVFIFKMIQSFFIKIFFLFLPLRFKQQVLQE